MRTMFLFFYLAITVWALVSIIFHGSRPSRSVSWALTVLLFPFLGPLLYYLFGVNRRKFKFYKLKSNLKRKLYDEMYKASRIHENQDTLETHGRLAKMLKNSSGSFPYVGNKVEVLHAGREAFERIFEALEQATKFIHVQYYIFEEGELQNRFYEIFKKKIRDRVEIRMMYDSLGSMSFKGKLKKRFRKIGVEAYPMMPLRIGNFMYTLNYRNHRKIIVVDGKVGFIGGMNVSDKYIKSVSELGVWEDIHLRLEGPVVSSLHKIFIKDYHFASRKKALLTPKYLPALCEMGTSMVQIIASGPDSNQPAILHQYVAMINLAKESISIANPYFIPGPVVLNALKIAALGGTAIQLLFPKISDSFLAKYSMYANFEDLLSVGIKIYLRSDFSHSKLIIVDGKIASVGSGNFDYRSFEHNFESNAVIYDERVTTNISYEFDKECKEATQLVYEEFKNRSSIQKFKEGLARFFSPLL
ncbi:cardiolipin synthase [Ulvibacterium marinum]|uniref:Cardiolipin synthase n=1 Tax=Ulvibacterium marinum TaxID=2419782 RepID=A0A3B0BQG6_9FLAO|nr:cardiolipin synthase [Ulvibacterium marinum]RKN75112.1 cardiolipin synthase [Ulvibacterium marinum]